MLQSFTASTRPEQGPPRLAALRETLARRGLTGFLVPRADAHQGEYVAPRDERLAWLTGFTGSAGFCIVLPDVAGVFVDGRYRLQVRAQCDGTAFTPVDWPETAAGDWLREHAPDGAVVAFDPWLHTPDEIEKIEKALKGAGITLQAVDDNPLDAIWPDQPAPPAGPVRQHPEELAGRSSADKRAEIAATLQRAGQAAVALTLPDSISWLLNLRGADIPRNPVVQAFAILHEDARLDLFVARDKLGGDGFGDGRNGGEKLDDIALHPPEAFEAALKGFNGAVRFDPATAPVAVARALAQGVPGQDPCLLPKARKTPAELKGMRAAHLRDGAAMAEFLRWFETVAHHRPSEIELAMKLEECRRATGALLDLSFETISGAGPNGAIVHYRVTEETNRQLETGELYLVDSGGQYPDGTTDITRTLPAGDPPEAARAAYTRVLQGMIAVSRARFPKGIAGAHLDALARFPLWLAGADYDHGTGHGVGAALSVHEGPVRISRASNLPLEEGMILSNEPGCYRAGEFGIRIENLVAIRAVSEPAAGPGPDLSDGRPMLEFETLTLAPIDTRLIDRGLLCAPEVEWLNAYHARVEAALRPLVSPATADWLAKVCAPI